MPSAPPNSMVTPGPPVIATPPSGRAPRLGGVLSVDSQPVVRRGVWAVLAGELGATPFLEAGNVAEALQVLERAPCDLVITGATLEGGSGFELTNQIQARWPHVRVLFFSVHSDTVFAERALAAGALGYVMKQEPVERLLGAVRMVLDGRVYVSDRVRQQFVMGLAGLRPPASPLERLSNRELEVFEHLGRGLARSEIARMLNLSVKTVESYRARIKQKLGLSTAASLSRTAVQWQDESAKGVSTFEPPGLTSLPLAAPSLSARTEGEALAPPLMSPPVTSTWEAPPPSIA